MDYFELAKGLLRAQPAPVCNFCGNRVLSATEPLWGLPACDGCFQMIQDEERTVRGDL